MIAYFTKVHPAIFYPCSVRFISQQFYPGEGTTAIVQRIDTLRLRRSDGLGNAIDTSTATLYAPAVLVSRGCHAAGIDETAPCVAGRMLGRGAVAYAPARCVLPWLQLRSQFFRRSWWL